MVINNSRTKQITATYPLLDISKSTNNHTKIKAKAMDQLNNHDDTQNIDITADTDTSILPPTVTTTQSGPTHNIMISPAPARS